MPHLPRNVSYHLETGVLGLHSRRTTCLTFLPAYPHVLLSGDKGGQVGVWHVHDPSTYKVHVDMNQWHTSVV